MGRNELINKFGWIPDRPDQRDKLFESYRAGSLPKSVDLRSGCSQVFDQGSIGSCTANAAIGALEFLEIKDGIKVFEPLSRLFLYYNSRLIENNVNFDSGCSIRDTVNDFQMQL